MEHCIDGISFLWQHLHDPARLVYVETSDISGLKFGTALVSSGALPCLVVNMGSALTIGQVIHLSTFRHSVQVKIKVILYIP